MAEGVLGAISGAASDVMADATARVTVNTGQVGPAMAKAGAEINAAGSGWGKAFKLASLGLGAVVAGFLGIAIEGVKAADALDASMARISSAVNLTTKDTAALRGGLIELSTKVPYSIGQLADSIQTLLQVGYSVNEALTIQSAAAKAATASNADLATVTGTVATAMKSWSIPAKDVLSVTDQLLTTVGNSRVGWDDLSKLIATAAPIAKAAGLSFADLNAAIIAVGRSGIPARRAASGVLTLIRSLSAPSTAMRTEMNLLGIKFDSTTLKQKGLLAVLQEFQKKAGDNVNVLIKNKDGTINYAKSLAATTKANDGAVNAMKTLTGGAAGLLTAQILLNNNASDFKAGMNDIAGAANKTADSFNAVIEADIGLKFDLIVATIKAAALTLGTTLLPYVQQFVNWLAVELPKAITGLNYIWTTYLEKPLETLVGAFGNLLGAIGAVFEVFGGTGQTQTEAIGGAFKTLGGVLGSLVSDAAGVVSFITFLISNPVGKALAQIAIAVAAFRLLQSGFGAGQAAITSKVAGFTSFLTGSSGGGAGAAGADAAGEKAATAVKEGADAMKTAADAHLKAANALQESAGAIREGALRTAEAGGAGAVEIGALGEQLAASTDKMKTAAEASLTTSETGAESAKVTASAASEIARGGAEAVAAGEMLDAAASKIALSSDYQAGLAGLKTSGAQMAAAESEAGFGAIGMSSVKGAVGSIGSVVSKVFWPLLAVQIGSDLIKAPLGDFIASNTKFQQAGAQIKEDFFGGLISLVQSAQLGTDAWVGLAQNTDLGGGRSVDTKALALAGLSHDKLAALQSGDASLVGLLNKSEAAHTVSDAIQTRVGNISTDYIKQVIGQAALAGVDATALQTALNAAGPFDILWSDQTKSALATALTPILAKIGTNLIGGADSVFNSALEQAINNVIGGSAAQSIQIVSDLSDAEKQKIVTYLEDGINGLIPPNLLEYAIDHLTAHAKITIPTVTPIKTTKLPVGEGTKKGGLSHEDESFLARQAAGGLAGQKVTAENAALHAQITALQSQMAATQQHMGAQLAATPPELKELAAQFQGTILGGGKGTKGKTLEQAITDAINTKGTKARTAAEAAVLKAAQATGDKSKTFGELKGEKDWADKTLDTAEQTMIAALQKRILADVAHLNEPKGPSIQSQLGAHNASEISDALHPLKPSSVSSAPAKPLTNEQVGYGGFGPLLPTISSGAVAKYAGKEKDDLVNANKTALAAFTSDPTVKTLLTGIGAQLLAWMGIGMGDNSAALVTGTHKAFREWSKSGAVPASPIRSGPLKHPFLPNIGRKMMAQIGEGMNASTLGMAGMKVPSLGGSPIGGDHRSLHIEHLETNTPADELSAGNMLRFLMPGGV